MSKVAETRNSGGAVSIVCVGGVLADRGRSGLLNMVFTACSIVLTCELPHRVRTYGDHPQETVIFCLFVLRGTVLKCISSKDP